MRNSEAGAVDKDIEEEIYNDFENDINNKSQPNHENHENHENNENYDNNEFNYNEPSSFYSEKASASLAKSRISQSVQDGSSPIIVGKKMDTEMSHKSILSVQSHKSNKSSTSKKQSPFANMRKSNSNKSVSVGEGDLLEHNSKISMTSENVEEHAIARLQRSFHSSRIVYSAMAPDSSGNSSMIISPNSFESPRLHNLHILISK